MAKTDKKKTDKKKIIQVAVGKPVIAQYTSGGNFIDIRDTVRMSNPAYTSLDDLIIELEGLRADYGTTYSKLSFSERHDCYCDSGCSCPPSYLLTGDRLETDLEYRFRREQEAAREEEQRERDLKELARLKSLYRE